MSQNAVAKVKVDWGDVGTKKNHYVTAKFGRKLIKSGQSFVTFASHGDKKVRVGRVMDLYAKKKAMLAKVCGFHPAGNSEHLQTVFFVDPGAALHRFRGQCRGR